MKVFVAGKNGMVGSSIIRKLSTNKKIDVVSATSSDLDLTDQNATNNFFKKNKFDQVYLAAAKVGGIYANNTYPADFIYNNLQIQNNVIYASFNTDVKRLLFLGSSCIYPNTFKDPIKEEDLLSSKLEKTNEPYAIAKIAGIKLCESFNRQHSTDFRSVMPTNLYGPGDNYSPKNSHVIPALIHKFYQAKVGEQKVVEVWGTGTPKREFMYVDDLADACIFVMSIEKEIYQQVSQNAHINIGSSEDISIKKLSELIGNLIGFDGDIVFNSTYPDGTYRKIMDSSRMYSLGWQPKISLVNGLKMAIQDYSLSISQNLLRMK